MWHKRDDMIVHETDPYNAEPPRSGLHDPITTPDSFYVRNHGPVPENDPGDWAVTVDGLVDDSASFTPERLREEFTHHTLTATMQCAGNRRALLHAAGELLRPVVLESGQADALDEAVGDLAAICFGNSTLPQAERDVFPHRQPRKQCV